MFALHALRENTRTSVEQAPSLYAKIVHRAASRIDPQSAARSAQKESTLSPEIQNALHVKQEHGTVRRECRGVAFAKKESTQPRLALQTQACAMYARLAMCCYQYPLATLVLLGPTQALRIRQLAAHAMQANTHPKMARQCARSVRSEHMHWHGAFRFTQRGCRGTMRCMPA